MDMFDADGKLENIVNHINETIKHYSDKHQELSGDEKSLLEKHQVSH